MQAYAIETHLHISQEPLNGNLPGSPRPPPPPQYQHNSLTFTHTTSTQLTHNINTTHSHTTHTHTQHQHNSLTHNSQHSSLTHAQHQHNSLTHNPHSHTHTQHQHNSHHLVTWTFTLHGRRGTYGTGLALVARWVAGCRRRLCVAGVALGDMDLHFA